MTCARRPAIACTLIAALLLISACSGEPVPWHGKDVSGLMPALEFSLVDEHGDNVDAGRFAGAPVLLFFGFTHCPGYCPTTLSMLNRAVQQLPESERRRVRILFVSVDPRRDTPRDLADYTDNFSPRVTGLTGSMKELRKLAKRYRTTFSYGTPDAEGNYTVSHGRAVYLFDSDGNIRLMYTDNKIPPGYITEDLQRLFASQQTG